MKVLEEIVSESARKTTLRFFEQFTNTGLKIIEEIEKSKNNNQKNVLKIQDKCFEGP